MIRMSGIPPEPFTASAPEPVTPEPEPQPQESDTTNPLPDTPSDPPVTDSTDIVGGPAE